MCDELVTQFLSSSIIPPDTHKTLAGPGGGGRLFTCPSFLGLPRSCRMNGADKGVSGDFSTYSGTHYDFLWQNKCHGTGYHHQTAVEAGLMQGPF